MSNSSKKNILAIVGSTRKNSSNEKILNAIATMYSDTLKVNIYHGCSQLPHFNPDLTEEPPLSVQHFYTLIRESDGVLICTPEYIFSLPGTLKNALEWTVSTTVFSNKPVAFIVASGSGVKAFESLDIILSTLTQKNIPEHSKLLLEGGRSRMNQDGVFTDNDTILKITRVVDSLIGSIREP